MLSFRKICLNEMSLLQLLSNVIKIGGEFDLTSLKQEWTFDSLL